VTAVNDLLKLAIEGHGGLRRWDLAGPGRRENWAAGDHSIHHPYHQADHGRSPAEVAMASAAAHPGGA
jgi:hypothetical protein